MNEFIYITIGILWAILGSFASAVIPRIKYKQDFVAARSECPNCHHHLGVFDLFPIFSFVFLLGKCRYCKAKIPPYHFLLEWSMVGGFLLVAMRFVDISAVVLGDTAQLARLIFLLISMFVTVVFTAYDLMYLEIPDEFMIPFLIIAFFVLSGAQFLPAGTFEYFIAFKDYEYLNVVLYQAFLWGVPIFLFFYLQRLVSNGEWIGGGDLRIAMFMGFVGGAKIAWVWLFLSYIIGSVVGVVLLAIYRKRWMQIPFWPFLACGLWASMVWYEPMISWYLKLSLI